MKELKRCPFCGGKAYIDRVGTRRASSIISCGDCGVVVEGNEEGEDTGDKWNERYEDKP